MTALGGKRTSPPLKPHNRQPLLAQLDRAPGFEPGGWGFKSLGAGHRRLSAMVEIGHSANWPE